MGFRLEQPNLLMAMTLPENNSSTLKIAHVQSNLPNPYLAGWLLIWGDDNISRVASRRCRKVQLNTVKMVGIITCWHLFGIATYIYIYMDRYSYIDIYIYIVGSWNPRWNSLHNFGVSIPSNGALTIAHGKKSPCYDWWIYCNGRIPGEEPSVVSWLTKTIGIVQIYHDISTINIH